MKKAFKYLPLVLLAVTAIALTGCDKILEAFFPEETGKGGGENFVTFRVFMSTTDVKDFWNYDVVVGLRNTIEERPMLRSGAPYVPAGSTEAIMEVTFEFVPDGAYRAKAWLDMNNNKEQDPDEPAGGLEGGRDIFSLPDGGNRNVELVMRIYPALEAGTNSIKVTIHPNTAIPEVYKADGWMMFLAREGAPLMEPSKRATATYEDEFYARAVFEYTGVAEGIYAALVWFDANGDWDWNPEEPGSVATPPGYYGTFPVPLNGDTTVEMDVWVEPVLAADVPRVAMKGPQIVALGDSSTKVYELVVLQTGGPSVEQFEWSIWGAYEQFGTAYGGAAFIVFDPGNFYSEAYFELEIYNVKLSDQRYSNNIYQRVRFINEAAPGTQYNPDFEVYNLDGDPHYLNTYSPYTVRLEFLTNTGTSPGWTYGNIQDFPGVLSYGYFYVYPTSIGPYGTGQIDYMPTYYGMDRVRIYVDTDFNGYFYDPNDLATELELGLSVNDGVYPYFNPTAANFIKYSDFDMLY